ncbi:two-partner secretion domain-containing protein, partial [Roseateles sp. GG27B]
LNPNGVLFGAGARVDVARLVTSTLNLNDSDWRAGRLLFTGSNPGGSVLNQGELRSSLGGSVWLLGGSVRNEGLIDAPSGHLVLAAGHSIELLDTGAPRLSVRVTASAGEALNLGTLAAAGGRIDIHAAVVNQQGIVRADTLSSGAQGEILLRASQTLNLSADSSTRTDGPSGGAITLDSGNGATLVHGDVRALGSEGRGGQITLLGRQVGVMDAARIDASGAAGGGQVLVGGGQQGLDASVPNAEAVFFGRNASISADATAQGDGGRIILWSDHATRAFGSLSAQGGRLGGNGGFIETSGGWLDARPLRISTSAPLGKAGQWLLDPYDVSIIDDSSGSNYDANFQATGDNAVIDSATLVAALNNGINVTVSTGAAGNTGTQNGDITLSSAHIVVGGTSSSTGLGALTLQADRNIWLLSAEISSLDQPLSISLSAARGSAGVGGIDISGSTLNSRGGNISLGGLGRASGSQATAPFAAAVGFGTAGVGVSLSQSTLNAGAGTLLIQGASVAGGGAAGVALDHATVSASVIDINGW